MCAAGAGSGAKREEANSCQMQQELKMKLCRRYAGLDAGSELKRGGGWLGRGKKIQAGSTSNVTGLGGLGMLIYWAGCGNDKR